jgi:Uma2 family endonuclease
MRILPRLRGSVRRARPFPCAPFAPFVARDEDLLGAPTLLVEVVSDPRTDRVRKRDRYARAGVGV